MVSGTWCSCSIKQRLRSSGNSVDGMPPIECPVLLATWYGHFGSSNVLVVVEQDWTIRVLAQYLCDIPAVEEAFKQAKNS